MTVLLQADRIVAGHPGRPRVLDGIGLRIEQGTRLALLGANGSGKTTLMSVLAGSLRPESGRVLRSGEPLEWSRKGLREHRRHVQMVLQDPDAQLFSADVAQDVSFGPMNLGLPVGQVRERVAESLRLLGADHLAERATHHLSYGERKRVATAGAVAMRPDLLLLDEPTAGLDPAGVRRMREALDRLAAAGTTILMATHDVALALDWADEAAVVCDAHVRQGPADELLADAGLVERAHLETPWPLALAAALGLPGRPRNLDQAIAMLTGAGTRGEGASAGKDR
ncbi:ATP-binding cassette domain-containing protein [uncultured Propionibacterium sp.]|uniref:energy-coupling factor ABC transporter ATP-binding protein n=1 Tax=uncultured Propionibacterium sp. TaxID=218066 RepID=UPI00292ED545|nr:ATP-binding cassette domain-containing protein [uncultured Propionibacterium sp.]